MNQQDRTALSAFILTGVFGGGMAVAIKFSVQELEPIWAAALRFSGAGVLFLIILAFRKESLPRGKELLVSATYGVLSYGIGFALAFYALTELEPGFAAVVLATVPLFTLVLAALHGQERITRRSVFGGAVALAGIVVMSGLAVGGEVPTLPLLAMIGTSVCVAESGVLVKSIHHIHPVAVNAVGIPVGAVVLLGLTLVLGNEMTLPVSGETWAALLYMVGGSVIIFIGYLTVVEHWTASRASYVVLVMPLITVIASVWLLDEQLGADFLAGSVLVLIGVYIGAITHHGHHHLHLHGH